MRQTGSVAILLVSVTVFVARSARAEVRTWTDSSGTHKVEAEFVDENNGTVRLRKSDGRIISLPLQRLCTADQMHVRKQRANTEAPARTADPLAPSSNKVTLELLTGAQVTGSISAKDDQSVTLEVNVGGRTYTRKYPLDRLKAVVIGDKREVLNAGSAEGEEPGDAASKPATSPRRPTSNPGRMHRSKAEIEALIDEVGRTAPDWWESTPLEYPQTLDLAWLEPAPGGWNNQRNIGQYLWDVIHPNPGKWRSGTRFVHYMLTYHKADPQKQRFIMNTLGRMYFTLLEDYPRAAFWWRKAGVAQSDRFRSGVSLAECYWRMGSKEMALDLLKQIDVQFSTIKLLGDMGETKAALRLADANAKGEAADLAYLYAGDACRVAGDHARALQYYELLLKVPATGRGKDRIERNHRRARANIDGIRAFELLDLKRVPDGTYRSGSQGYEAEVGVEVVVKGGRIELVRVTSHREKQFYSSMTDTPRKIIARQGVTGIDATSGATITSEAIINATAKALAGAMK